MTRAPCVRRHFRCWGLLCRRTSLRPPVVRRCLGFVPMVWVWNSLKMESCPTERASLGLGLTKNGNNKNKQPTKGSLRVFAPNFESLAAGVARGPTESEVAVGFAGASGFAAYGFVNGMRCCRGTHAPRSGPAGLGRKRAKIGEPKAC